MGSDIRQLLNDAQAAHVGAHGPNCGVFRGGQPTDPCMAIRRAWATVEPLAAGRERAREYARLLREPRRTYARSYRAAHREEILAAKRALRTERPEYVRAIERASYERHREERLAQSRAYRAAHREDINARRRMSRPSRAAVRVAVQSEPPRSP